MSYVEILRVAAVAPLVLATAVSRLPVGLNPLASLLVVHQQTGSYAAAGIVTGALTLGTAVGQPVVSRLVDARGIETMVPAAGLHAAGLGGVLAFGHAGGSTGVLAACALLAGFALPPTSSVLRASWPRLFEHRPALLPPAFALDAVLVQLSFMAGPLIVAVLAVALTVDAALVLSGVAGFAATAAFVARAPSRRHRRRPGGLLGPLSAPALQTLVLSQIPWASRSARCRSPSRRSPTPKGIVSSPACSSPCCRSPASPARSSTGHVRDAGPCTSSTCAWRPSCRWGWHPWPSPGPCPPCASCSCRGALLSAFFATRNELAGAVAPPGTRTEAVTWPLTALIAGNAAGAVIAGAVTEGAGWRTAVLVAASAAALGAALVCLLRGTLVTAAASH